MEGVRDPGLEYGLSKGHGRPFPGGRVGRDAPKGGGNGHGPSQSGDGGQAKRMSCPWLWGTRRYGRVGAPVLRPGQRAGGCGLRLSFQAEPDFSGSQQRCPGKTPFLYILNVKAVLSVVIRSEPSCGSKAIPDSGQLVGKWIKGGHERAPGSERMAAMYPLLRTAGVEPR